MNLVQVGTFALIQNRVYTSSLSVPDSKGRLGTLSDGKGHKGTKYICKLSNRGIVPFTLWLFLFDTLGGAGIAQFGYLSRRLIYVRKSLSNRHALAVHG